MKFPRSGKERETQPAPESATSEQQHLCPQCNAKISSRARTCLYCGADLVAIAEAETAQVKAIEQEQRAEAAQRPTRIFVILFMALAVFVFVAIIIQTSRSSSVIAALTPTITRTPTRPVLPTATPRPTATATGTPTPVPPLEYTVKGGDTPGRIALLYDVSLAELMAFNSKAEDDLIVVGEVLKIPPPTPKPGDTATPEPGTATPGIANEVTYIVQAGDTLSQIATTFKVSLDEIQRRNNISDISKLMPGQQLIIATNATLTPTAVASTVEVSADSTPTPIVQYAPVKLLTPLDREIFVGDASPILLQWLSSGVLQPNELYLVQVERAGDVKPISFRTRATSYHLLPDQYPPAGDPDRTFRWRVMIIRQEGTGSDSALTYRVVSPVSESNFEWLDTLPTPTPTATPQPGSRPAVEPSATPTVTP